MEGECYDYDADIDELFHLAAKVICPASYEEVHACTVLPFPCFFFVFDVISIDNYLFLLYM